MSAHFPELDTRIAELISGIELAYWESNQSQHDDSKSLLELCLQCKHPLLGYAYLLYGRTLMLVGELEQALLMMEQGVAWCRKKKDQAHLALGLLWLGSLLSKQKKYPQALKIWVKSLDLALAQENLEIAVEIYLNLGCLYLMLGLREECYAILMDGFSLAETINNKKLIAKSGVFLSDFLIESGQYLSAMSIIARSELDIIRHADFTWVIELCKNKACCLWKMGYAEDAMACFESGIILARKFDLAWACIMLSIVYAEFLLEQEKAGLARQHLDNIRSYFNAYSDAELYRKWCFVHYQCAKAEKDFQLALASLKAHQACQTHSIFEFVLSSTMVKLKTSLKKLYPGLRRDFRNITHLGDAPSIFMTMKQLLEFKKRCESGLDSARVIEVCVPCRGEKQAEQRVLLIINDYCSVKDVWIRASPDSYYVFPSHEQKSLHAFSTRLLRAIATQPWARLKTAPVQARTRILMVSQDFIRQVDQIIQRGWHDAR
ncbi:hypothetical protein ABHF33_11285 [Chitinibacter sp. FCG-7]|uniref:Tetratricopeptide repeat protein n=1 Tax=Chitinibacter mangrovi TaxID=3153927 RepID=A0AAU7F7K6_9NEIS